MKIEELEKLCKEATPPPWRFDGENILHPGGYITKHFDDGPDDEDARFIAAARTYLPKLLAVARAAKVAIDDWYFDENYKDLCRALEEVETPDPKLVGEP